MSAGIFERDDEASLKLGGRPGGGGGKPGIPGGGGRKGKLIVVDRSVAVGFRQVSFAD
jgi:hypothetical protein